MTQRPDGYRRYESERVFRGLDALRAEAGARGVGMAGLALAWLLSNPDVESIVVGPACPCVLIGSVLNVPFWEAVWCLRSVAFTTIA